MSNTPVVESNTVITPPMSAEDADYLKFMGGRKFALSLLSIVFTGVLCWFGKIDPGIYSVVVVSTIGAYTAGNVIQNIKS